MDAVLVYDSYIKLSRCDVFQGIPLLQGTGNNNLFVNEHGQDGVDVGVGRQTGRQAGRQAGRQTEVDINGGMQAIGQTGGGKGGRKYVTATEHCETAMNIYIGEA